MNYTLTGKYYYEPSVVDEENTIEEEKFELITTKSDKNLCDMQNDECKGDTYYTDQSWAITHWCEYHFNENVKKGIFKEL